MVLDSGTLAFTISTMSSSRNGSTSSLKRTYIGLSAAEAAAAAAASGAAGCAAAAALAAPAARSDSIMDCMAAAPGPPAPNIPSSEASTLKTTVGPACAGGPPGSTRLLPARRLATAYNSKSETRGAKKH